MIFQNSFLKKLVPSLLILCFHTYTIITCLAERPSAPTKHSHRHNSSPGFSRHRNTVYIPKKPTHPSPPNFVVKFFPMITKPRKFFIKDSMIKKVTSPDPETRITKSDFKERVDIIALEISRLIDIGDPSTITIKRSIDFDVIYKIYIELSQKLTSLVIKNISSPSRQAIESLGICEISAPLTETESLRSDVDPRTILRIGEWYKIPIEIELDEKEVLNPIQVAAWHVACRYTHIISTKDRGITFLLRCMHNLFTLLLKIFPETETA